MVSTTGGTVMNLAEDLFKKIQKMREDIDELEGLVTALVAAHGEKDVNVVEAQDWREDEKVITSTSDDSSINPPSTASIPRSPTSSVQQHQPQQFQGEMAPQHAPLPHYGGFALSPGSPPSDMGQFAPQGFVLPPTPQQQPPQMNTPLPSQGQPSFAPPPFNPYSEPAPIQHLGVSDRGEKDVNVVKVQDWQQDDNVITSTSDDSAIHPPTAASIPQFPPSSVGVPGFQLHQPQQFQGGIPTQHALTPHHGGFAPPPQGPPSTMGQFVPAPTPQQPPQMSAPMPPQGQPNFAPPPFVQPLSEPAPFQNPGAPQFGVAAQAEKDVNVVKAQDWQQNEKVTTSTSINPPTAASIPQFPPPSVGVPGFQLHQPQQFQVAMPTQHALPPHHGGFAPPPQGPPSAVGQYAPQGFAPPPTLQQQPPQMNAPMPPQGQPSFAPPPQMGAPLPQFNPLQHPGAPQFTSPWNPFARGPSRPANEYQPYYHQ